MSAPKPRSSVRVTGSMLPGTPLVWLAGNGPGRAASGTHAQLPGRLVVSNVVSFARVRGRPPRPIRHGPPSSRTVVNSGERRAALLESVLVPHAIRGRQGRGLRPSRLCPIRARRGHLRARFRWSGRCRGTASGAVASSEGDRPRADCVQFRMLPGTSREMAPPLSGFCQARGAVTW
jgi:hypothetical protein